MSPRLRAALLAIAEAHRQFKNGRTALDMMELSPPRDPAVRDAIFRVAFDAEDNREKVLDALLLAWAEEPDGNVSNLKVAR